MTLEATKAKAYILIISRFYFNRGTGERREFTGNAEGPMTQDLREHPVEPAANDASRLDTTLIPNRTGARARSLSLKTGKPL